VEEETSGRERRKRTEIKKMKKRRQKDRKMRGDKKREEKGNTNAKPASRAQSVYWAGNVLL
jgi:hypothetical protein